MADLQKRRPTPTFYERINNGRGFNGTWKGTDLNIGKQPSGLLYDEVEPKK